MMLPHDDDVSLSLNLSLTAAVVADRGGGVLSVNTVVAYRGVINARRLLQPFLKKFPHKKSSQKLMLLLLLLRTDEPSIFLKRLK